MAGERPKRGSFFVGGQTIGIQPLTINNRLTVSTNTRISTSKIHQTFFAINTVINNQGRSESFLDGKETSRGAVGSRIDPAIELFLVAASAKRRVVTKRPWNVLSCLWDGWI